MPDAATPTTRSDESDIAYLKRLAVAGRGEPAPFLLLMAVFGGSYGFAILAVLIAFLIEGLPRPGGDIGPISEFLGRWAFIAAPLAILVTAGWTAWRTLGPNRVRLSRGSTATWSAAFIGLVTTVVSFRIFTQGQLPTDGVYAVHLMPVVLLVLWGGAWWVTAILNDRRWLLLIAIGSFAAAIAIAVVGNYSLPLICACLLLLAFLPAVILMRQRAR